MGDEKEEVGLQDVEEEDVVGVKYMMIKNVEDSVEEGEEGVDKQEEEI